MWRPLVGFLLCMLCAAPGVAGPWPREPGAGFASVQFSHDGTDRGVELYGEYGLSDRLTLGGNAAQRGELREVRAFSRWHLHDVGGVHPVSVQLGLVSQDGPWNPDPTPRLTGGMHFGLGFAWPGDGGWARVSLMGTQPPRADDAMIVDLDAELGLRPFDSAIVMLRFERHYAGGARYTTLVPGAGLKLGEQSTVVAQATFDTRGAEGPGMRLGLWRDF